MSARYFDRDGQPITLDEWARTYTPVNQRVILHGLADGTRVSTVWLGIDHRIGEDGPPLIFETMIFDGPHDGYRRRYSTEADALVGHREILTAVHDGTLQ